MNSSKFLTPIAVATTKMVGANALLNKYIVNDKWWALKVGILVQLFSLCVSFPSYDLYLFPNQLVLKNWEALNNQFLHPLTSLPYAPNEHYGQISMRLTLPLLSYLFNLRVAFWLALQPLVGIVFMALVAREVDRLSSSRLVAFAVSLGLAATYVGKSFWVDVLGYFDGYAFFLLLLAGLSSYPVIIGICAVAACFVDERSYLILPLIGFYHLIKSGNLSFTFTYVIKAGMPVGIAAVVAVVLRYYLGHNYNLLPPVSASESVGLHVMRENYMSLPILYLGALDGYWLCFIYIAISLWLLRQKLISMLFVAYSTLSVGAVLIILDVTRAGAYFFPVVLAFVATLYRLETRARANIIVASLTGLALFIPPIFSVGNTHVWMGPALPKVIKIIYFIITGLKL